jgi:hypothetical protein
VALKPREGIPIYAPYSCSHVVNPRNDIRRHTPRRCHSKRSKFMFSIGTIYLTYKRTFRNRCVSFLEFVDMFLILGALLKFASAFKFWLKSEKNKRHITWPWPSLNYFRLKIKYRGPMTYIGYIIIKERGSNFKWLYLLTYCASFSECGIIKHVRLVSLLFKRKCIQYVSSVYSVLLVDIYWSFP